MRCTLLRFARIIHIFKFNKACKNSQLSYQNRSRSWTIFTPLYLILIVLTNLVKRSSMTIVVIN